MDTDGVEIVDFNALGGADTITVNDLTGTDVTQTNLDLAGRSAATPATARSTAWSSTARTAMTAISIDGNGSGADVTGLATAVSVTARRSDRPLSVNTLAGTDNVFANGVAGVLQVLVDGAPV